VSGETVLLEVREAVAVVTLNRPDVHNAVDASVMDGLERILDAIDADAAIRAIVLTGAGDRTFSSGGDLRWFASLDHPDGVLTMSRRMQAILARLHDGDRPVVAAANGQALGGGCEILTACHLRVAAPSASFSFRQAANGLITGWGGGLRLIEILGRSPALDLLLTSRTIDAREAERIGFMDRVADDSVLAEAFRLAKEIAANAPGPVRAFLETARLAGCESRDQVVERETALFVDHWASPEFQAVLRSFRKES